MAATHSLGAFKAHEDLTLGTLRLEKISERGLVILSQIFEITTRPVTEQDCFDAALSACKRRDWALIKRGGELISQLLNTEGRSLLQEVIYHNEIEVAKKMAGRKITIHSRDLFGRPALYYTAMRKSRTLFRRVVRYTPADVLGQQVQRYIVGLYGDSLDRAGSLRGIAIALDDLERFEEAAKVRQIAHAIHGRIAKG